MPQLSILVWSGTFCTCFCPLIPDATKDIWQFGNELAAFGSKYPYVSMALIAVVAVGTRPS